jgi:hypothetical protein
MTWPAPLYDEVVAADAEVIDMSQPRLFWTDAPGDLEQLRAFYRADEPMAKWATRVPGAGLKFLAIL